MSQRSAPTEASPKKRRPLTAARPADLARRLSPIGRPDGHQRAPSVAFRSPTPVAVDLARSKPDAASTTSLIAPRDRSGRIFLALPDLHLVSLPPVAGARWRGPSEGPPPPSPPAAGLTPLCPTPTRPGWPCCDPGRSPSALPGSGPPFSAVYRSAGQSLATTAARAGAERSDFGSHSSSRITKLDWLITSNQKTCGWVLQGNRRQPRSPLQTTRARLRARRSGASRRSVRLSLVPY